MRAEPLRKAPKHYQMELLLNNEPYRNDPEVTHGIKF